MGSTNNAATCPIGLNGGGLESLTQSHGIVGQAFSRTTLYYWYTWALPRVSEIPHFPGQLIYTLADRGMIKPVRGA